MIAQRLKAALASLEQEDMLWWAQQHQSQPSITQFVPIEAARLLPGNLILVVLEGFPQTVLLNGSWLQSQQKLHRPLRLIHTSLETLSETGLIDGLMELLNTHGCMIMLHEPLRLPKDPLNDDGFLIAGPFRLLFDHSF